MKLIDVSIEGLPILQTPASPSPGINAVGDDQTHVRISLKQWRVLHAVIDCNGFTAAAEKLQISQSAISYTVAKIQEQLGITLFRIEGRKALVTEEGRALLEQSRSVIRSAIALEAMAEKMRQGWKPELRLVVHHECPQSFLTNAINFFCAGAPDMRVSVIEGTGDDLEQAIHEQTADLAICVHAPLGMAASKLISVDYVAVSHPEHALARLPGPLNTEHFVDQTRIIVDMRQKAGEWECSRPTERTATQNPSQWRAASFDMALLALEQKLGYAWLPREKVLRHLQSGALKRLEVSHVYHSTKDFYLVRSGKCKPDTSARKLADMLCLHAASMRAEPP